MSTFRLHPKTCPAAVALTVVDLAQILDFYQRLLELWLHRHHSGVAVLGAGGPDLLSLYEDRNARRCQDVCGLYHFAVLLPDRRELGRVIARLIQARYQMMTGYAASKGVPSPKLAVVATGVLLLLGGLSILLGYQPTIGVLLIVIFLVPVAFMMHKFWAVQDPQMKTAEMVNFMKNIALAASALMFLAIPQPWPFSLGG